MTGPYFVDTNVFVSARDSSDPERQSRAALWIEYLWAERAGRVSFQVLQELYSVLTRKLNPSLSKVDARQYAGLLMVWEPVTLDFRVLSRAWAVQDHWPISWWDALIVSAAQLSGSKYLLTEDLQDRQSFDSLRVVNPFETAPGKVD